MTTRITGSTIYGKFFVGTTGLVQADFSYGLTKNNSSTSEILTITEDSLGWYNYSFAGLLVGQYIVKITYQSMSIADEYTYSISNTSDIDVNTTIYQKFFIGVTGLVQANFTAALFLNNIASGVSFTITEDALGWYNISFLNNAYGDWLLRIDIQDYHFLISAFVGLLAGGFLLANIGSNISDSGVRTTVGQTNLRSDIR